VKDHLNADDFIACMTKKNILLTPMGDGKIRIVTHLDFSIEMLEKLVFELKDFKE
jgi:threonine aldolase